ncbi:MAG: succinate dehydrogenase iron-sulfur subunit [Planctomycetes bacterium]|nr:succinate dehydrogenase iron-sulfur subunit [Planctomycetota bacterium]
MSKKVKVNILRQDSPDSASYWQRFELPVEHGMNVTTILLRIAAMRTTLDGDKVSPVAYDACCLEEVCGACSMRINGRVRQACSALVDNLLQEEPEITLEPMTKFPKVRDLVVDRRRIFEGLKRVKAWAPVDGYGSRGTPDRMSQADQEEAYPLSRCMSCGCCMEACPQFNDRDDFIGPHAVGQAILFNTLPAGKALADDRLDALAGAGGIAACGNAQNCVKVCPKDVPLTISIAKAGRATTFHTIKRFLKS